jgi:hypothetical protein
MSYLAHHGILGQSIGASFQKDKKEDPMLIARDILV